MLKHLKKILAALAFGFIAFAPPGTLIIIAIFLLGLFGKVWLIVGIVAGLILAGIYAYIFRARLLKSRFLKTISRKLKIKKAGK